MNQPEPPAVSRRGVLRGAVLGGAAATAAAMAAPGKAMAAPGKPPAELSPPSQAAPLSRAEATPQTSATPQGGPLLCEPYLLDPTQHGVRVVWHTEQCGGTQAALVGPAVAGMDGQQAIAAATGKPCHGVGWRRIAATSTVAERTREDSGSTAPARSYAEVTARPVWRHVATVEDLPTGRTPYRVVSVDDAGSATVTAGYSLAPALPEDSPARLLLTSDHQLKTMTPANLEQVAATVGVELDGVLFAGDMVNVADRPSEWFDSTTGLAFFASFTGRGNKTIAGRTYTGAPILQHTPLYPAIGNHEVMGRWSTTTALVDQFNDPQPTAVAQTAWQQTDLPNDQRDRWLRDHSWNVDSYQQMFPYPRSAEGGSKWYSRTIGDVHLTTLFVTGVWRPAATTGRGKFTEAPDSLGDRDKWGYGQFVFEPITRGSRQYTWLERQLTSPQARRAKYRVVMFHHPSHGLGDNSAPPLADPAQTVTTDPATGAVTGVAYAYPLGSDAILRDLEPLLISSKVNLVHNGHSHVWNRFRGRGGVHWLETSNVGNTYGAFDRSSGRSRALPVDPNYILQGDPGGLLPTVPSVAPLTDDAGNPLPYLSSNDITCFTVLDSAAGMVRSYRFDTRQPNAAPVLFDAFGLS